MDADNHLELMQFECMTCSRLFSRRWFDINKGFERVIFQSPERLDEVEVQHAEGIGVFCSAGCHNKGRAEVMRAEGVAMPSVRPGIGPIEKCAKCSRPVDMSDWHLTYSEGECEETPTGVATENCEYLAVICRDCAPLMRLSDLRADVKTDFESILTPSLDER